MAEIIEISKLKRLSGAHRGCQIVNAMDEQDSDAVLKYVMHCVLYEVRVGNGLIELTDEEEETWEGKLYEMVDEIYKEAAGDCYFCNGDIDPNETKPDRNTRVCLTCGMKINYFLRYLDGGKP